MSRLRQPGVLAFACIALAAVAWTSLSAREAPQVREITITANNYGFSPSRIEVQRDELVKITFTAVDIPHSFTIDEYRIAKRAAAGQSVVFEFRADRAGTFRFYCNITQDERCRNMHGELVVQ